MKYKVLLRAKRTGHARKYTPYSLSQDLGGVFRHEHVAGESLVCRMFRDEAKVSIGKRRERDDSLGLKKV